MRPEGTSVCGLTYKQRERELLRRQVCCHMLLCVRIRQHASAYVYIPTNRERQGSVDGSPQAGVAAAACRLRCDTAAACGVRCAGGCVGGCWNAGKVARKVASLLWRARDAVIPLRHVVVTYNEEHKAAGPQHTL